MIGKNDDQIGPGFPDMTFGYDGELKKLIMNSANEIGYDLQTGIYAAMTGPSMKPPQKLKCSEY